MSYIAIPRLAFAGNFQADVSTVNNDVRHYDSATFQPTFQQPGGGTENGWYNPEGTGAFRLIGLRVRQALSAPGPDPSQDPAVGLFVNAQGDRSSCKIVDLDPQMQVVSTLFGLRIVLTDGTNEYLSGTYAPSPFRDMANNRVGTASAVFTSVLTDLEWSNHARSSPTLVALKTRADLNGGKLSINLTPYAYGANQQGPLIGAIGAYTEGDPDTFVAGRRLTCNGPNKPSIGDMMADVSGTTLSFDFSNSIALNPDLTVTNIGTIFGAILRQTDVVTGFGTDSASVSVKVGAGETLTGADIKRLDAIDYLTPGFLGTSSGIADCELDAEAQELVKDHPVAIVGQTGADAYEVLLRETNGGLFARADNFVLRMDTRVGGAAQEPVRFKVTQWGKQPAARVTLTTEQLGPEQTNHYWGPGGSGPNAPTAPYPEINTPSGVVSVSTAFESGPDGWAVCPVSVTNPGNPRGYVDGQIYTLSYQIAVGNASPQPQFDLVVIHARQAQAYPDLPSWSDLEPFMRQYDNLYPIMSRHLFSLADPDVLERHATLLTLAFSRPLDDPNHMPATRDLSASKRQAILNWLAQFTGQSAPLVDAGPSFAAMTVVTTDVSALPAPAAALTGGLKAMLDDLPEEDDAFGKNPVMRAYLSAEIARLQQE